MTVGGALSVDQVLGALAGGVRRLLRDSVSPDMHAALDDAARVDLDWGERLAGLRHDVLDDVPVLLVLDNFEDNLIDQTAGNTPGWRAIQDEALADLLAELAHSPGRCRRTSMPCSCHVGSAAVGKHKEVDTACGDS